MFLHSVIATTSHIKKQIGISVLNKTSVQTDLRMHLQWCRNWGGLRGLEVTYLCYKRKYTVCGVTRKSASIPCFMPKLWSIVYVCRFPIDNKENTVREYIQETYNIQLMCPHLPCLHVGKNVCVYFICALLSVNNCLLQGAKSDRCV